MKGSDTITNERKTRMVKDKAKQGTDCYTFEVSFQGDLKNLPRQPLINEQGKTYGSIEVKDKKSTVCLILPKFIRDNNIQPFTIMDSICLEMINCDCEKQVKQFLGNELYSKVKTIECNITQKVSGEATQSDVLNLLDHAFLTSERDNLKYVGAGKKCKYKEETHTLIVKRPHYYILKAYDKTEQQKMDKKHQNQNSDTVPDGLLRIEIIMVERTLEKMFGDKRSFSDILTRDSLIEVLREYKRIFCTDIKENVEKYRDSCKNLLVESLFETDSVDLTVARERELIPDKIILKRAIQEWQKLKSVSDNSARDSEYYARKYALPQHTIRTLHDFKKSCG